ncbi:MULTISPECIES: cation diffusion facilitator family transporter [Saccharopolyspora]|uniref:Cation diffusion facilitator family transporter n=1 Tax=Saccharopolyspora gregorii TaxID=33914 RepID=A0ABP6RUG9_9PSEU|nr:MULTISPECIES: cation diffusion facilitator family transporter [Saccharopolyspora]MCA1189714.1 cation diffusion facilitator family transporter [Saccharopolyspora sp. 6T]MCA1194923.1 cation diffusion facilitator family transporter [Saccharopolyspora sp. 6V]MCA1226364.1 cation diffusion facilitator family transporter [Saccharopolyspora sp. 6M]MCA1279114.1 cation diffusion facilitator family transporter [Saccharopolyspora sp. 7B]
MAEEESGESTATVLLALGANLAIGLLKLVAGLITGSGAMLAEAAHSAADTTTQGLLLTGLRRSSRPADRRHPFGYGKARYFWALIAAVSIFVSGGVFAIIEGVRTVASGESEQTLPWVAYAVLGGAFLLEGTSWLRAVLQVRAEAKAEGTTFVRWMRGSDDPTVVTVFFEDGAALIGLLLAFAGVGLHQLTGSGVWDGVASLLIGVLLAGVAYALGRANMGLLIGRSAGPALVRGVREHLAGHEGISAVVDLMTMMTGTDRVLLCARLDFRDSLSAGDVERLCVRLDDELRARFPDLDEIFLEPVPREDPHVRARRLARYGLDGG